MIALKFVRCDNASHVLRKVKLQKQHKRILVKISGEALMGEKSFGHDPHVIRLIASDIKDVINTGVEVCIVVGGGNIYRGIDAESLCIERTVADHMGMLGTVINALALQNMLEGMDVHTRVLSAIPMITICEPYIRRKAKYHMEKGRIVIFAAGTGNPFFTTDSAAVLRAIEMNCDLLLKGTQVDGVYDCDPVKNPQATKYSKISYNEVLRDNLRVMDMSAIALAKENHLPIRVFSIKIPGNLANALSEDGVYTEIS